MIVPILFSVWLFAVASVLYIYRLKLLRLWREPVLRCPVLIVESDDWGAGPLIQAKSLGNLATTLARFRDCNGRHPVMTLAIILAVPDGLAIAATGRYHRLELGHPCFRPVRDALKVGEDLNVFSLQLHGLEHYRPATLMAATQPEVRNWLTQDEPQATELLEPSYQSRWIDATTLPSQQLCSQEISVLAEEETALYSSIFGRRAKVAVPPTFIWNEEVESSWASHGVEFVVTPGRRYSCRNDAGDVDCAGPVILSGERGGGVTHVVRNDYFEPFRGHTAGQGLDALRRRTRQGRACLLETHRINFITASETQALMELGELMEQAIQDYPGLHFMDTFELGRALRDHDASTIESGYLPRIAAWVARTEELPRFHKLACLTGLAYVMRLAATITSRTASR